MLTGVPYSMAGSSTYCDVAGGPSIEQFTGSTLRDAGLTSS
jgi:hypothetical protein